MQDNNAPDRFSSSLLHFFDDCHNHNIQLIEWGTGLVKGHGANAVIYHHIIIVPAQQFSDCLDLVEFHPALPPADAQATADGVRQNAVLQHSALWFSVSDQPFLVDRTVSLVLVPTTDIPIDLDRLQYLPKYQIWRPDIAETLASFVRAACLYHRPDCLTHNLAVCIWLMSMVVDVLCQAEDEPKDGTETPPDYHDQIEAEGLKGMDLLVWTDDTQWLRHLISNIITGRFSPFALSRQWWADNVGEALESPSGEPEVRPCRVTT